MHACLSLSNRIARDHCAESVIDAAQASPGLVIFLAIIGAAAFATLAARKL